MRLRRKGDFGPDEQVEAAFDLVSTAGAQALGITDYGIAIGGAANLFTIAASYVAEAVAAIAVGMPITGHPPGHRRRSPAPGSHRT
jgi:cytosine/adenosine deaminase-related metal-dependent hydrolase